MASDGSETISLGDLQVGIRHDAKSLFWGIWGNAPKDALWVKEGDEPQFPARNEECHPIPVFHRGHEREKIFAGWKCPYFLHEAFKTVRLRIYGVMNPITHLLIHSEYFLQFDRRERTMGFPICECLFLKLSKLSHEK